MSNNKPLWHPYVEKCGFILQDGSVVEVDNISPNPQGFFQISEADIEKHGLDNIAIFWHSHPNNDVNLSVDDYHVFLRYPDHIHRIYGQDHFAEYYVRNKFVMRVENDSEIS